MGTRRPTRAEYMPHCFPVRLAAEPDAYRYLEPALARLRGGHWVQKWNSVAFVYLDDLADGCRLVLTCPELRLVGTSGHDMPVPPAENGGEHYTVRIVLAIEGGRDDPRNRATGAYLGRVVHRYAIRKGRLDRSGARVARVYLPTLRDAVDLIRACPHLKLVADRYQGESLR